MWPRTLRDRAQSAISKLQSKVSHKRYSNRWVINVSLCIPTEAPSAVKPHHQTSAVPVRHPKMTAASVGGVADHESYLLCPGRQPVQIPTNHNVSRRGRGIRIVIEIEDKHKGLRVIQAAGEKDTSKVSSPTLPFSYASSPTPTTYPGLRVVAEGNKAFSTRQLHNKNRNNINRIIDRNNKNNNITSTKRQRQGGQEYHYHHNNYHPRPPLTPTHHIIIDIYH